MQNLQKDFEFIIITNQSGISKGYYTKKDFDVLTEWMLEKFKEKNIQILDIFYCSHRQEDNCECRKPKIGMIKKACEKYDIDLQNSWLVGDNITDIQCAINANIKNKILVNQNNHNLSGVYVVKNLENIDKIILKNTTN